MSQKFNCNLGRYGQWMQLKNRLDKTFRKQLFAYPSVPDLTESIFTAEFINFTWTSTDESTLATAKCCLTSCERLRTDGCMLFSRSPSGWNKLVGFSRTLRIRTRPFSVEIRPVRWADWIVSLMKDWIPRKWRWCRNQTRVYIVQHTQ